VFNDARVKDISSPLAHKVSIARPEKKRVSISNQLKPQGRFQHVCKRIEVTGDDRWRSEAWQIFKWFLGDNDLQRPLYDSITGGCRDGLHPDRVNENQGSESTLSFLTALTEMRLLEKAESNEPNFKIHAIRSSAVQTEISAIASK